MVSLNQIKLHKNVVLMYMNLEHIPRMHARKFPQKHICAPIFTSVDVHITFNEDLAKSRLLVI